MPLRHILFHYWNSKNKFRIPTIEPLLFSFNLPNTFEPQCDRSGQSGASYLWSGNYVDGMCYVLGFMCWVWHRTRNRQPTGFQLHVYICCRLRGLLRMDGWTDGSLVAECIVRRWMGQASGRVYYCWWQKETETLIDFVLPFNSHAWPNSRSRRNSLHFDYLAEQSSDKPKPPSCARHMPHVVNYWKTTRCSNAYLVAWIPFVPSILFHLSVVYIFPSS